MPKQKRLPASKLKKTNIFLYEIKGILLIFISIFSLLKLGAFGFYLSLILKLLFGDFYFLIIILLFILGIYYLFKHELLKVKTLTFFGCLLVVFPFIILSHFAMHDYIVKLSESYFKDTILLYLDYFKKQSIDLIVGGGVIGAIFFYLLYFLLSRVGLIIASVLLIVLGFCILSRKTIIDYFYMFEKIFAKSSRFLIIKYRILVNSFKNMKFEFRNPHKRISKTLFKESIININARKERFCEYERRLIKCLDNNFIYLYDFKKVLCPHLYVFIIKFNFNVNQNILYHNLKEEFNDFFLLKKDDEHHFILELTDDLGYAYHLGDVLKFYKDFYFTTNNYNNDIGFDDKDKILFFELNERVFSSYVIQSLLLKEKTLMLDLANMYPYYDNYLDSYETTISDLESIIEDVLRNMLDDCNIFITINKDILESDLEKIRYLIELLKVNNVKVFVKMNKLVYPDNYFYDSFKVIVDVDILDDKVLKLFGFTASEFMNFRYAILIKEKDLIYLGTKVELTEDEEVMIKNKVI